MAFDRGKTGMGGNVAFGTTTGLNALQFQSITIDGISVADLDLTHLQTSGYIREYGPADTRDGGTLTIGFIVDQDNIPLPGQTAANAAPTREVITVTQPITDGTNGTAGTLALANSYINNTTFGLPNDGLSEGEITIKVGGAMTFTASSA